MNVLMPPPLSPPYPCSLPHPSSPQPISHLMCGGCWESHAKMNNNQLLLTIEHDHTCRLCARVCVSRSLFLSVIFFPTFCLVLSDTHKQHFPCDLRTHWDSIWLLCPARSRLTAVLHWHLGWRSYRTFRSSALCSWPAISVVGDTEQVTMCVRVCAGTKTAENVLLVVQYQVRLISTDTVNVCGLRQICWEVYWLWCLLKCNQCGLWFKCKNILLLVISPFKTFSPKSSVRQRQDKNK